MFMQVALKAVVPDLFPTEWFPGEPPIDPTSQLPTSDATSAIQAPSNPGSTLSSHRNPGTSARVMIQRAPRNVSPTELFRSWLYAPQESSAGLLDERVAASDDRSEGADWLSLRACASEHRVSRLVHFFLHRRCVGIFHLLLLKLLMLVV
jgi:hypothetical protein